MKKYYSSPIVEQNEILTASIICGSNPDGSEETTPPGPPVVRDAPARKVF